MVVQPNSDSVYCLIVPLEVVLQNTGLETLTSAILTVTLNGIVQPSITWTGNLASGQFTQVSLGELPLVPLLPNTITIQCSSPNGGIDQFSADDQLVLNNLYSGLSGNYTIGGINPDFPILQQPSPPWPKVAYVVLPQWLYAMEPITSK